MTDFTPLPVEEGGFSHLRSYGEVSGGVFCTSCGSPMYLDENGEAIDHDGASCTQNWSLVFELIAINSQGSDS